MLYPGREQTDGRFDCTDDEFAVEAPAGAALFFNIYLLHRSLENSGTDGYRRARHPTSRGLRPLSSLRFVTPRDVQ